MEVIPKDMLDRVAATFSAYLLISDYSKQYRDEIMTGFKTLCEVDQSCSWRGAGCRLPRFQKRAGRGSRAPEKP